MKFVASGRKQQELTVDKIPNLTQESQIPRIIDQVYLKEPATNRLGKQRRSHQIAANNASP